MLDLGIFGIKLKKLSWYVKSAPSNLSNCEIWFNKCLNLGPKMLHLGTKNASFECFCPGISKQYCHIWIEKFANKRKLLNVGPKTPYLVVFWGKF